MSGQLIGPPAAVLTTVNNRRIRLRRSAYLRDAGPNDRPRDQTWEDDAPSYRVFFWTRSSERQDAMWAAEEWELTEADIHEVLRWIRAQANGRRSSLWAVINNGDGVGHIRLTGTDPTAPPGGTWPAWADVDGD